MALPGGFEHRRRRAGGGLPDELFRAGVQFADGSKATSLESGLDMPIAVAYGEEQTAGGGAVVGADDEESEEQVPQGPVLMSRGGGGGQRYSQSFWLWPLPPEGSLSFVCEWPALDIALSRVDVDSALFREAASRSRPCGAIALEGSSLGGHPRVLAWATPGGVLHEIAVAVDLAERSSVPSHESSSRSRSTTTPASRTQIPISSSS